MDWYYVENGASRGPVPLDEVKRLLRQGRLHAEDLVWTAGFGDQWKSVADVPELNLAPTEKPSVAVPRPRSGSEGLPERVTLSEPARQAWEGMKMVLFRPFDMGKWFLIGFSSWLATLGQGGGAFNWNPTTFTRQDPNTAGGPAELHQFLDEAKTFWAENGALIISIGAAVCWPFPIWARSWRCRCRSSSGCTAWSIWRSMEATIWSHPLKKRARKGQRNPCIFW